MSTHPDEHLLIYEPDQQARAAALLLWQHRGKVRIEAFVRALARAVQLQEDTIWAVIVGATTIQGAEGVNLDRWGAIVGEMRGGLTSTQFRKFIELRIRANRRKPTEDEVYGVLAEAVLPGMVRVHRLPTSGLQFNVDSFDLLPEPVRAHTAALVRDMRPAGVHAPVVEAQAGHFAFDWENGGTVFGSVSNPGSAVFGRLIYSGRGPA